MGGNLGCHRSIPKDPTDLSLSTRKFSAACNFSHILVNQERLNINTATEEELMTLPGVNRAVAQNIVEYRECIGGYKKVEDLALVSGIGATKLETIKLEICVSSKNGSSQHSPSSLRKDNEHLACTGMNVNTATAAQLMSIRGITEKIAKSIVDFRAVQGPFKSIEDLVKVNYINSSLLDKIRFQVFVERSRTPSTNTNGGFTCMTKSQPSPTSYSMKSEELDLPPGGPSQILSARPTVEVPPRLRDGRAVLRIATWNLQRCSSDKANNPGVKEVVCMTLLENDIKILAVQDLVDRDALDKFCGELNQPILSTVKKWREPRGLWKCCVSDTPTGQSSKGAHYSGFLWDSSCGIELKEAAILENPVTNGNGKQGHCLPYLGRFYVGSSELTLVNVHVQAPGELIGQNGRSQTSNGHKAPPLSGKIQETLKGEKEVLVLGDFGLGSDGQAVEALRKERLTPLVPPSLYTNISTSSPRGSLCLDNIWLSRTLKKIYTGHCCVVREGLTNPWIPDNWSWGGVASDHCPVVAEFFVDIIPKEPGRHGNGIASVDRGDTMPKHER
ncbi:LOW QUALITY PROTEIN: endonuclease/exonuclease/phosphatase family domain-containing protein 1 [Alosa alosa]|uniref:LOW QUALITY PROTEIN: endonuclease/exonuclease/phosphatase family domain-containing protein 1 n=1 Tax=Alosa alosa TaxID=278164 RepID=UPI0020150B61|nr:LOW QUALITY PROTEIN: endonuclease/exonuclease/phosphatase family domain-containing protein 1 [Alosa alosa]